MPYNSQISRSDSAGLIPPEIVPGIIQNVVQQSATLSLMRQLPNMSTSQTKLTILNALATAYFVDGDTGLIQTTKQAWLDKYIYAEELAVIVPIPKKVLRDSSYDMWGATRPGIEEAFGRAIDQAVLYSTNKPSTWPDGITVGATAAGHVASRAAYLDLYDAILGENGVFAKVEADGYAPSGHIGTLSMKSKLRGCRSADGVPIFTPSPAGGVSRYELDGRPIMFPENGAINESSAWLVSAAWSQFVFSIREDIEWEILTEAVIQDNTGAIIYNLAQQSMVGLKATMRLGWQIPNPVKAVNTNAATRYPGAILTA